MNKQGILLRLLSGFFFFSWMALQSTAQGNIGATDQSGNNQEAGMADLSLRPIRLPALQEVGGSPFMSNDYKQGSVQISNDKIVNNVLLKFNIYSNAMMIQRDGEELKLETFDLASYDEPGNGGTIKHMMFRQGYPEIDNHPPTAIYQVLAMGQKIHLLKFLSQKVEDVPTLGDYSRREIVTTSQLYVYIPGGEMKKIKSSKQSIVEAAPGLSSKIDEIVKAGELNLKNESDIIKLANELNK
jgi:hypothetical protein